MFRAIETTEIVFTKKAKVKTRKPLAAKRPDTPRPTDEELLTVMTAEVTVMPTVQEQESKKPRNTKA